MTTVSGGHDIGTQWSTAALPPLLTPYSVPWNPAPHYSDPWYRKNMTSNTGSSGQGVVGS